MLFILEFILIVFIILLLLIIIPVFLIRILNIRENQTIINKKVNELLNNIDFNISKTFYINDYATHNKSNKCKKIIIVDNDNKKICLIDYEKGNAIIADFDEIINYEIYENGGSQTTGSGIGTFGLGLFGTQTSKTCKELKLIIRLKKFDNPQITYEIISNTILNLGYNKSSIIFKNCISSLQEVVSFLEVIKTENNSKHN